MCNTLETHPCLQGPWILLPWGVLQRWTLIDVTYSISPRGWWSLQIMLTDLTPLTGESVPIGTALLHCHLQRSHFGAPSLTFWWKLVSWSFRIFHQNFQVTHEFGLCFCLPSKERGSLWEEACGSWKTKSTPISDCSCGAQAKALAFWTMVCLQ